VIADGLDEMAFSLVRAADHEQDIAALPDELAGGQLIHLLALDGRIKGPVEVLQRFVVAEAGGFLAFVDHPLMADVDFILEDQFQELFVGQLMDAGFLQAKFQAGEQAREAELAGSAERGFVSWVLGSGLNEESVFTEIADQRMVLFKSDLGLDFPGFQQGFDIAQAPRSAGRGALAGLN
jgi:hypothetical protein